MEFSTARTDDVYKWNINMTYLKLLIAVGRTVDQQVDGSNLILTAGTYRLTSFLEQVIFLVKRSNY